MATTNGSSHPKLPSSNAAGGPPLPPARRDRFAQVAAWTTRATGGRWGFLTAFGAVILWAICGPIFHYSDDWQLVINTSTTIVTFLMVFLIQNAQNRESKAVHLKLDELIFAVKNARNEMIDIERLTEEQLDHLGRRYAKLAGRHHMDLEAEVDLVEGQVEDVAERVEHVEQKVDQVKETVERTVRRAGR